MKNDVAIIYCTCDKYSFLWEGFFTLLSRYWNNCDLKIVLNTESKEYNGPKFNLNITQPLQCSKDVKWSKRLLLSLEEANTEYVILFLDDFYLKSQVNEKLLNECMMKMRNDKKTKVMTFASQVGTRKKYFKNFELRKKICQYRINAQIGIWRTDYLKKIIRVNENPWEFEINGSFRSSIYGGKIYSIIEGTPKVFDYDYGFLIIRGKQNTALIEYFNENEKLNLNFPIENIVSENIIRKKDIKHYGRAVKYSIQAIISFFRRKR